MIESLLVYFQVMERIVFENDLVFQSSNRCSGRLVLANLLQSKINERNKSEKAKSELYIDWKNGDITHEEYIDFKKRITERINTLNAEIDDIQLNKAKTKTDTSTELFGFRDKGRGICRLTRAFLIALVDRICIRENNSIIVKVKFDILSDAIQLNA